MIRRVFSIITLLCLALLAYAQAPEGYYNAAAGRSGKNLKTALYEIICNHTVRSYDQLWTDFRKTDARADGKVWDMYSAVTNFTFGDDQAGNYKREGDVYNREHSFPKSWFNDAKPMYSDLFHLVPTDGYVNGMRSNLPFGETDNPTYSSQQGWSKVGSSSVPGYTGKVFEPNDEYKGDFARIYFYMATRYENLIANWNSDMLAHNAYPAYKEWAITMLLRWAKEDPVSQKEKDRNNAIFGIQHNRNPYVDFPGLEQYVWGAKTSEPFNPGDYNPGETPEPDPEVPEAPVFSPAGGMVPAGTQVTISCSTPGAYVYYTVGGEPETVQYPPVSFTVDSAVSVSAYALLGERRSETVTATFTVPSEAGEDTGLYELVNTEAALEAGHKYIIVAPKKKDSEDYCALSAQGDGKQNDIRLPADVVVDRNTVQTETGAEGLPYALTLGGTAGEWTLCDEVGGTYLCLTASANKLHSQATASGKEAKWTITFSGDNAHIVNADKDTRRIRYNSSSPRFACYTGSQLDVSLYKQHTTVDGIRFPAQRPDGLVDVLTLDGRVVRRGLTPAQAVSNLPAGLYIIGGKKILVRH